LRRCNFFVTRVTPRAVGRKEVLTKEVMAHYIKAQPDPASRAANAAFPEHIVGASDWLREIWNDRASFIGEPALLLWGPKDIGFRRRELETPRPPGAAAAQRPARVLAPARGDPRTPRTRIAQRPRPLHPRAMHVRICVRAPACGMLPWGRPGWHVGSSRCRPFLQFPIPPARR
jgi:hypothetical protein